MQSKSDIEKIIQKKVEHFAYPYGEKEDAGIREFSIIQDTNYKSALTTQRFLKNDHLLFSLPRYGIDNYYSANSLMGMLFVFDKIYKLFLKKI